MTRDAITLMTPRGMPHIVEGDDLGEVILQALAADGVALRPSDIVVVAQKIVSKAEGKTVDLSTITPSDEARDLEIKTGKDPRLLEVILRESVSILRSKRDVCIAEHRLGLIMANAGIDHSNVSAPGQGDDLVLLLPDDPDASALALRRRFEAAGVAPIGVIVSDSFGRPWRLGTTGIAIGAAGPASVIDRRGEVDMFGRTLESTEIGFADGVAAAAVLAMGEAAEATPVAVVRGLTWTDSEQKASDVLRPRDKDLFR